MKVIVYHYPKCSTCRNALKWLDANGVETERIDIVAAPPSKEELRAIVKKSGLELKKFFNTSGEVYKSMGLKDKLPQLNVEEQLELLASNGKLLKRPIVTDGSRVTVGFKEETFAEVWS